MSIKIMTAVWDSSLERNLKFIALAYADFCNDEGESLHPSTGRIAYKCGYEEHQVRRLRDVLIERKILIPLGRSKYNTRQFRFDVTALPGREPFTPIKMGRPKKNGENDGGNGTPEEPPKVVPATELPDADHSAPYRERTKQALIRGLARQAEGEDGYNSFPEDVQPVVRAFCEAFGLTPPEKPKGGKGEYAAWITQSRELLKAINGDLAIIKAVADAYWIETARQKRTPYTVARPAAIKLACTAKVAELKVTQKQSIKRLNVQSYKDDLAGLAAELKQLYQAGRLEDYYANMELVSQHLGVDKYLELDKMRRTWANA